MKIGIALLAYSRPRHLKNVLKSIVLEKINEISIYIDGPANNEIKNKQKTILNVIKTFKKKIKIKIIQQTKNHGLAFSVTNAVTSELKKNDAMILLEDDCVLLKGFFAYMKRSLKKYQNIQIIRSICSFNNSFIESKYSFFSKRFNPWAWGTWKNRWKNYNHNLKEIVKQIKNTGTKENLPLDLKSYCNNSDILNGKQDIWSLSWTLTHYLDNSLVLYPPKPLVQNIGFDGSGVHCIKTDVFKTKSSKKTKILYPKKIEINLQNEIKYNNFLVENSSKTFFKQKKVDIVEPYTLIKSRKYILDDQIKFYIEKILSTVKIFDIHTHLYPERFKKFYKTGLVEVLNYHYLLAELFSLTKISPKKFYDLKSIDRAKIVWENLFLKKHPFSTATNGVLKILQSYEIKNTKQNFAKILDISKSLEFDEADIFKLSGVDKVVMTNNPFDQSEYKILVSNKSSNYLPSIRIDDIFEKNFKYKKIFKSNPIDQINKFDKNIIIFFDKIIKKTRPVYFALSTKNFEEFKHINFFKNFFKLLKDYNLPLMLLVGVKRKVNPLYGLAGDGLGNVDLEKLEEILLKFPNNKFLVTCLNENDQFPLTILSRKFQNLQIFGFWWFNNNPSIVKNILNQRLDLLGDDFIFQHSDARIIDQLIYKWYDFKNIYTDVMTKKYKKLLTLGYRLKVSELEEKIEQHFRLAPLKYLNLNK